MDLRKHFLRQAVDCTDVRTRVRSPHEDLQTRVRALHDGQAGWPSVSQIRPGFLCPRVHRGPRFLRPTPTQPSHQSFIRITKLGGFGQAYRPIHPPQQCLPSSHRRPQARLTPAWCGPCWTCRPRTCERAQRGGSRARIGSQQHVNIRAPVCCRLMSGTLHTAKGWQREGARGCTCLVM